MQVQLTVELPKHYAAQLNKVSNTVISRAVREALDREAQTALEKDNQAFDTVIDEVIQSSEMHQKFKKLSKIFTDKNM